MIGTPLPSIQFAHRITAPRAAKGRAASRHPNRLVQKRSGGRPGEEIETPTGVKNYLEIQAFCAETQPTRNSRNSGALQAGTIVDLGLSRAPWLT